MARFGMKTRDLQPPKPSHRPFVCPVRSPARTGALRGVRLPVASGHDGVGDSRWSHLGASGVHRSTSIEVHAAPLPAETSLSRTPSSCSRGFLNRVSQVRFLPGAQFGCLVPPDA
jgi:hypothetical protein